MNEELKFPPFTPGSKMIVEQSNLPFEVLGERCDSFYDGIEEIRRSKLSEEYLGIKLKWYQNIIIEAKSWFIRHFLPHRIAYGNTYLKSLLQSAHNARINGLCEEFSDELEDKQFDEAEDILDILCDMCDEDDERLVSCKLRFNTERR